MLIRRTSHLRIICAVFFITVLSAGTPAVVSAGGGGSSEASFFELYAGVIRAVDKGALDNTTGEKVRALHSSLQKQIIALDTRLNRVKALSMEADRSRQSELLDELVALGAERERLYLDYQQRLERLLGTQNFEITGPVRTPRKDGSGEPQQRTVTFENVPEDISTGQFD